MGFIKPDLPDVDPDTFMQKPLMERMRILAIDWVDNGLSSWPSCTRWAASW
jgi:hypothetical protein